MIIKRYKQLTEAERDLLAKWKAEGISNGDCAKRLKRDKSTIGRELARNSFEGKYYVAIHAEYQAKVREQKKARGKQPLKNPDVFGYVTKHLRCGWSPDEIAGRLRRKHKGDKHWYITAETIYRWIYEPEQVKCEHPWYEYLRRKQKKRKKQTGRKVYKSNIPDRVSISERPEEVNARVEFGHWEGDTVESKGHRDGIHTEVERMSRKVMAKKVERIAGTETITVQKQLFLSLPEDARCSTTLDNGRENHLHTELKNLKMKTYFAHPYSSFERGTNEHGNWLIRYYFPKGTDFKKVSDEELQDVIDEINNRPRKILDYQTANERFAELLEEKQTGVAVNS